MKTLEIKLVEQNGELQLSEEASKFIKKVVNDKKKVEEQEKQIKEEQTRKHNKNRRSNEKRNLNKKIKRIRRNL